LIVIQIDVSNMVMTVRRITVNLPGDLLDEAMEVTGKGITETIIDGLEQVKRRRVLARALALRGKLRLDIDLDRSRERRRR